MSDAPSLATQILSRLGLPLPTGATADLLMLSAQAHREYRQKLLHGQLSEARAALTIAAQSRAQAELQDASHADTAWGSVPVAVVTNDALHTDLLEFYLRELSK